MAAAGDALEQLAAPGEPARRVRRHAQAVERLAGVALLFAVWELVSRLGWIDERLLGAPSTTLTTGWELLRDGSLGRALAASAERVALGLALGTAAGAVLALIAGLTRAGDAVVDANLQMLRYVPVLALQPLLIVWFGIGEMAKIVLIGLGVAFPVYVNTVSAIRAVHSHYYELADVLGLGHLQRMRRIVLPGARRGFLVGVRYATAIAWLLVIVAEQINAEHGLGRLLISAQAFLKTEVIVVCVVTYAAVGVASDFAIRGIERWSSRWEPR